MTPIVSTCPAWCAVRTEPSPDDTAPPAGLPRWSNKLPPPPVGATVDVRVNSVGPARVLGYFTADGFLGLYVRPLAPPAWYTQQNGHGAACHVYGAEITIRP